MEREVIIVVLRKYKTMENCTQGSIIIRNKMIRYNGDVYMLQYQIVIVNFVCSKTLI